MIVRRHKEACSSRAVSVPFASLYIENRVLRAICCRLSCCNYLVTRIRILPEEPFFSGLFEKHFLLRLWRILSSEWPHRDAYLAFQATLYPNHSVHFRF